jgi:hypothetical protein
VGRHANVARGARRSGVASYARGGSREAGRGPGAGAGCVAGQPRSAKDVYLKINRTVRNSGQDDACVRLTGPSCVGQGAPAEEIEALLCAHPEAASTPHEDGMLPRRFSIQFVQVLTNLWYSHTYNFVTLSS